MSQEDQESGSTALLHTRNWGQCALSAEKSRKPVLKCQEDRRSRDEVSDLSASLQRKKQTRKENCEGCLEIADTRGLGLRSGLVEVRTLGEALGSRGLPTGRVLQLLGTGAL